MATEKGAPATQKERLLFVAKRGALLLGVGFAYLIFVALTGLGIPCLFYELTDLHCPGCGISRMFVALAQLDFETAIAQNALVMLILPFLCYFVARHLWRYIRYGSSALSGIEKRVEQILVLIAFALSVAFWIMRNTVYFDFLAPY